MCRMTCCCHDNNIEFTVVDATKPKSHPKNGTISKALNQF